MKVLYIVNSSSFFISHFSKLAEQVLNQGHEVYVVAGDDENKLEIESKGFQFKRFELSRRGSNLFNEIKSIISLYQTIHSIKPQIMHMFTIKPIIYGCLLGRLFSSVRTPLSVASITGLGSASLATSYRGKVLWFLLKSVYKFVLYSHNTKVVFENTDDRKQFTDQGIVPFDRTFIVNGAGVDTGVFYPSQDLKPNILKVVLVARLLKDKGIREYIDAGRLLKERNVDVHLQLVGSVDPDNISSMRQVDIDLAHEEGHIEYLGKRNDIAKIYQNAHVACLPSYREGLPKSLIEGAACGLAIVTSDVPGCRQLIFDDKNGLLVTPKSTISLVQRLSYLSKNPQLVAAMGQFSREKALALYDHSSIVTAFFRIYEFNKSNQYEK